MLLKVVLQKPVPGKSEPKEKDLLRNRRVLLVEVPNRRHLSGRLMRAGEDYNAVIHVEEMKGTVVVLSP